MKSYVHVYTGEGKGKTTAALGLALRAAGAGHKVFLAQFVKKGRYSELNALKRLDDLITVEQFGMGRFIKGNPSRSDIDAARNGLKKMQYILTKDLKLMMTPMHVLFYVMIIRLTPKYYGTVKHQLGYQTQLF